MSSMDHHRIKEEQRALYEAGDYAALSATLRPAAFDLVATAGVQAAHRVLDVGAGDGNLSIEATDLGALAVACDLSVIQMARARRRDARVASVAADAEHLPFADHSFEAVLSCFGAVFAPDPDAATAELFRVVRTHGVVALTSWPDDDMMAEMAAAARASVASPEMFPDQDLGWGDAETARSRFKRHCREVEIYRRMLIIDPAVRGAAGAQDCAARYLTRHTGGDALATVRAEILRRYARPDGTLTAHYFLVLGRPG